MSLIELKNKKYIIGISSILIFILPLFCLSHAEEENYQKEREAMVNDQIKARGILDKRVLIAMNKVKRHLFVSRELWSKAYSDHPLPIGEGQTISQPYVVALMTEGLKLNESSRVLEIGTGSGYQAAILAEIAKEVYSIEIRERLVKEARERLKRLGYANIYIKYGDGYFGWEEMAPFDAIIVTCAVNHIPPPLIKQLKEGGRLILPLGSTRYYQTMTRLTKEKGRPVLDYLGGCKDCFSFVPMIGEAQKGGTR
jgi:protein-L-isoaspartate(D-aspartate) O-methyltransferase